MELVNVTDEIYAQWQAAVDLTAQMLDVPVSLVMRATDDGVEVFVSARTGSNPYRQGERFARKASGLYCEAVLETGEPLSVPDAAVDKVWKTKKNARKEMTAYFGLPVRLPDGRLFGTVCVQDTRSRNFTEAQEMLLTQQRDLMESHLAALRQEAQLDTLLKGLQDGILLVDIFGSVSMVSPRFFELWGIPAQPLAGRGLHHVLNILSEVVTAPDAHRAQMLRLPVDSDEAEYGMETELLEDRVLESHSIGIVDKAGNAWGRVWLFRDITERKKMECTLRELSAIDCLTGLPNRRRFLELGDQEVQRALRIDQPLSLLLLDIDNFRRINDTHGNDAGDTVLCELVEVLRRTLRDMDILARYGGEEFAILLPGTPLRGATLCGDRLRRALSEQKIEFGKKKLSITVSIGASSLEPPMDIETLLRHADDALYDAKQRGRNRVEAYRT